MRRRDLAKTIQVIAHRGWSSLLPENTLQSIEAAAKVSSLVEFDIMLSKDQEIVIFHDRYLGELTDVAHLEEFRSRQSITELEKDKEGKLEWWVKDFTVQELKRLRVVQNNAKRPQFKNIVFRIPTLKEAIEELQLIKATLEPQNRCGFLIELKSHYEHRDCQRDMLLVDRLIEVLKTYNLCDIDTESYCQFPIKLQSFNETMLKKLSEKINLPLYHLFGDETNICQDLLTRCKETNLRGIGITEKHWDPTLRGHSNLKELCLSQNLQIMYWTVKDDEQKIPFGLKDYSTLYHHLRSIGVDGIITQFPDRCRLILQL